MESDVHISGPETTLGEEEYRKVFNGTVNEGVNLSQQTKPIKDMTDEELTAFIYEMERFVKLARIVTQAARINIEDRKLRYTDEQRAALKAFDKTYKPRPVSSDRPERVKKEASTLPKDPYDKKVAGLVNIMGMTQAEAEQYLAGKGITRDKPGA